MATSCSFRRILDADGREIIGGAVQRSDNHPDLHFANGGPDGPDARLVLAAPELLEALERISRAEADGGARDTMVLERIIKIARAAIAKARGE